MKLNLKTIVWGEEYTDTLIKYALPSHFSKNNLLKDASIELKVYTTPNNFDKIRNKASEYIKKIEFVDISNDILDNVQHSFHGIFKKVVKGSVGEYVRFITPDNVVSDGSISFAWDKIRKGYKAVVVPFCGLRVYWDKFVNNYCGNNSFDNLYRLFREYAHNQTKSYFANADKFLKFSQNIFWEKDNKFKMHCNGHQPFIFFIEKVGDFKQLEIDMMTNIGLKEEDIFIADKPGDTFELGLTKKYDTLETETLCRQTIAYKIRGNSTPFSLLLFRNGYGNLEDNEEISEFVDDIIKKMR